MTQRQLVRTLAGVAPWAAPGVQPPAMLLPVVVSALLSQLPAAPISFQDGVQTPPMIGNPGSAALNFANSRKAELGLDVRSTLVVSKQLSTRFGGVVHLEQQVNGLTVHGAKVIITFDEQQRVVRVSSSLRRFGAVKTTPVLDGARALELATHEVDGAWLRSDGVPYGGYKKRAFVVRGELHAGFLTFVPTLKMSDSWHVAIDAIDGSVLYVENRTHAANDAKVYASSPGGRSAGVGVTPVIDAQLTLLPEDGGYLTGSRIRALNCCPTLNCQTDAGPARAQGQQQTFNGVVDFDVAICDQRQRATNDPALHASGNYVYPPVDPPGTANPTIAQPADYDEFAEVHAYYHVSKAYQAVRNLSVGPLARDGGFSPFAMRNVGTQLPAVWVNVSDADFQNAQPNAQGVYVSNTLARTENAMFLARENMEFLLLPPQILDSDALVIYQGAQVDFAYDGPVLWHELGHGIIHSTADWETVVSIDERSSNNESSALHEGVSDLIAAMTGNDPIVGAYVGPRLDPTSSAIRNVNNTDRCPDALWGESHQDSLYFTGAVWAARQQHFLGTDQGATFDAALYAAIVSFPPDVNFVKAAQIIASSIGLAFPNITDARQKMEASFDARGVTNCSKVLDITDSVGMERPYYGIPGTTFAEVTMGNAVPGPYQFKIHAPRGAKSVTATMQGAGGFGGGGTVRMQVLADVQPITFTRRGPDLTNNARWSVVPTSTNGVQTARVPVDVECGDDIYVALGNTSQRDRTLFNLSFSFEEADGVCPEPVVDAGVPDAGVPDPDPVVIPAVKELLGGKVEGCGCSSTVPFMLFPALMLFMRRRRRS